VGDFEGLRGIKREINGLRMQKTAWLRVVIGTRVLFPAGIFHRFPFGPSPPPLLGLLYLTQKNLQWNCLKIIRRGKIVRSRMSPVLAPNTVCRNFTRFFPEIIYENDPKVSFNWISGIGPKKRSDS